MGHLEPRACPSPSPRAPQPAPSMVTSETAGALRAGPVPLGTCGCPPILPAVVTSSTFSSASVQLCVKGGRSRGSPRKDVVHSVAPESFVKPRGGVWACWGWESWQGARRTPGRRGRDSPLQDDKAEAGGATCPRLQNRHWAVSSVLLSS